MRPLGGGLWPLRWGVVLLCVWLIATGAIPLLGIGSGNLTAILNVVAILAGCLIWIDR